MLIRDVSPQQMRELVSKPFSAEVHHLAVLSRGLYVLFFENESEHCILDRNRGGKVFALAHGMTIKFGKFEHGFAARMRTNLHHLHRRPPGRNEEAGIMPDCFRFGYVREVVGDSSRGRPYVRSDERHWNRLVRSFLTAHELLSTAPQRTRAECRYLDGAKWSRKIGEEFQIAIDAFTPDR